MAQLEQEVARLQQRVVETSRDVAAARILAGGADRDVADVTLLGGCPPSA